MRAHRSSSPRGVRSSTGAQHSRSREDAIGEAITIDENGCWIHGDPAKYSKTALRKGETITVHRFVYETLVGPIPEGFHLHHTCETRGCCNPAHLEALSPGDHLRLHRDSRGIKAGAR